MFRELLVSVVVACLVGCADGEPAVSRVQPNAVEKSAFEGEWYYLQTVIDAPFSATYTFVGEQSLLEKVEWEIQEDLLIARRSYEFVAGSESEGIARNTETGAVIAAYAIQSHFDIRRDYNPVTGEEQNLVVENDTDRPWYDRRFMRVDWSRNLVSEPEFLAVARLFDGVAAESIAYDVRDPNSPNAPRFETDDSGRLQYFDIVHKMFVQPTSVYIDGWGDLPTCWLEYNTHEDCAATELGIRQSFMRADDRDYQPWDYPGDRMDRFGYFVSERPGYDPQYGPVEIARHRFVNRHDLWRESHKRDGAGQLVACHSDDECADGRGSVCDLDLAKARRTPTGACTIPYRDRETRAVPYHLSEAFPEELRHEAQHLVDEWNGAYQETIASLRENECLGNGGDGCAAEREREADRRSFVLCGNPVAEGEHEACGPIGTVARIGDLRYSLLAWVPEPLSGSPLGYGPSSADPETGEIVQANAFIYGAGVEELAAYARDLVGLLGGDVDPSSIVSGANVRGWVERTNEFGRAQARAADEHTIGLDGDDVERIGEAMLHGRVPHDHPVQAGHRPRSRGEMARLAEIARGRMSRGEIIQHDGGRSHARAEALRGTELEQMLTGPESLAAAGIDPRSPSSAQVLDRASPLRGASLRAMRALEVARKRIQAERCVLRADFADEGLIGLARAIRAAVDDGDGTLEWYGVTYPIGNPEGGVDYEAVRQMLRHPIFESTASHEVGHTLGLRHNFSGSYDSLNYDARYWELRDDGTMRPRAWDPLSETEIAGRIREYQYSTVMDYGNNFVVSDVHGIGHYDHAAIKMGYGDMVEVFADAADPAELAWVHFMQIGGWPVLLKSDAFENDSPVTAYTYTDLPALIGGRERMEQRADVPYTSLQPEEGLLADGIEDRLVDGAGRPVVPYRFCSDETVDLGPDCQTYDSGADSYEALQSVMDSYWNYYIFAAFRRERLGYDVESYYSRIYDRYFSKLQSANHIYVFNREFMEEVFGDSLEDFFTREDGMAADTLSIGASFSLLTRVITAPEPGPYETYQRDDGSEGMFLDEYADAPDTRIDIDEGRYLETTWNFDSGYYWFDQLERAGFFYDKTLALEVLTDPETFFIGKDGASDVRGFSISFHSSFPDAMTGFVGGLLSEDWNAIAPRRREGRLVYPDPLELAEGPMRGTPIDPRADFTVQLYGAVFATTFVPLAYDHVYGEKARIFVEGGAESVTIPAENRVTFTDPSTGLVYVAASYEVDGVEQGVGARMLRHAQALADQGADDALDEYMDVIGVMRLLTWELGFGS